MLKAYCLHFEIVNDAVIVMRSDTFSRKTLSLLTVLSLVLCISPLVREDISFALSGADVAVYNDVDAPVDPITGAKRSGVWQDGITAIKCMLDWMGFSHEEITYQDLNNASHNLTHLYKILLFPGGFAYWYNYWISIFGKNRIRNFANSGGGYFGICAGSFFASEDVVWEGIYYGDNYMYNAYGELTGYDLDLFPGTATGPINGIAPWPASGMTKINFQKESEILSGYRTPPFSEEMLYYGGPFFTLDQNANVTILGNFDYNQEPALVAFTYGSGRIVLTGPHSEIEENSQRDCITIDGESEMTYIGANWELTFHLLKWIMETSHPSCPDCSNGRLEEVVFPENARCECNCADTLNIGKNVVLKNGSIVTINAPTVNIECPFYVEDNTLIKIVHP